MKIVYTKHGQEKFAALRKKGWIITRTKIRQIINKPKWKGSTRYGQETVIGLVNDRHILRIILDRKNDIIKVITFHIGRRGRYESTL